MTISKSSIDRLGENLREIYNNPPDNLLSELQEYRTSHKTTISATFNELCDLSKRMHSDTIHTYRIKRIESIISKLKRYPEMRFSRMWDIAGCRSILRNTKEVYDFKKIIENSKNLKIIKVKDYIQSPQSDGYKSLHLFIKHVNCENIVELQIRSKQNHNWATLVEITDVLLNKKIKELNNDEKLVRFHYLLSKTENTTIQEKFEIAQIIKDYNYFGELSKVFSRNYLKVRINWFMLNQSPNSNYFLIETPKDGIPKIKSYKTFIEAENEYFTTYRYSNNLNVVLTHLRTPNYNQISIAYSNYILTFHSFLYESLDLLESLLLECLKNEKYIKFLTYYDLYNSIILNHIKNIINELEEIKRYSEDSIKTKLDKRKIKEWFDDLRKQVIRYNSSARSLQRKVKDSMPKKSLKKFIFNIIIRTVGFIYRKKTERIINKIKLSKK